MKAFICVDYLSHCWDAEDLVCSYRENKQKASELRQRLMDNVDKIETECQKKPWRRVSALTLKEKHRLSVEEYRLQRLENALWRQMAKNCTNTLGKANRLINPSEVNWQKECDITWLYGPLYQRDENDNLMERCPLTELASKAMSQFAPNPPVLTESQSAPTHKSYSSPSLKSALKRRPPTGGRQAELNSLRESWTSESSSEEDKEQRPRPKRANSLPCNEVISEAIPFMPTKSLRFNPVIQVEYVPSKKTTQRPPIVLPPLPAPLPPPPRPTARPIVSAAPANPRSSVRPTLATIPASPRLSATRSPIAPASSQPGSRPSTRSPAPVTTARSTPKAPAPVTIPRSVKSTIPVSPTRSTVQPTTVQPTVQTTVPHRARRASEDRVSAHLVSAHPRRPRSKSLPSHNEETALALVRQNPGTPPNLSEACINIAGTVKDIIALCGTIVVYRSISVGVTPIVWLAQHWVQNMSGRDARV